MIPHNNYSHLKKKHINEAHKNAHFRLCFYAVVLPNSLLFALVASSFLFNSLVETKERSFMSNFVKINLGFSISLLSAFMLLNPLVVHEFESSFLYNTFDTACKRRKRCQQPLSCIEFPLSLKSLSSFII